ncbi:MAG: 2,5-diketo-D-gluconate reductase, partial [Mycobacterium sp.]|nr:2,5-diketo-D-gluconate reductase [Mycobacterium sp.]
IVTERPPSNSRLTRFGIRGSARIVKPASALTTGPLAPRGDPTGVTWPGRLWVMAAPSITLNDGNAMPQVGLGVWQTPPEDTVRAVAAALDAGYRHIDTAAGYFNEREVGQAVAAAEASGVAREDVFITTKLWNADQGYETTLAAFDASMDRLGVEYLDLYLIHWPMPARNAFVDTFKAFAHLRDQGRIRSIGVSNFEPEHLRTLVDGTGIVPVVNQVELHPLLQQQELREVHAQLGVATEAWSPLGQGSLLSNPTVTAVAEAHGKTPAQVLIRWHIQLGNIVIPKSVTPERIVSNFDVFDFELSEQDMASISSLGDGTRLGPDPRTFNFTG